MHARALQHGAHRATSDDPGTSAGRTQQHHTRRSLALDGVRDRATDAGNLEEVLLRLFDSLGDGGRHLLGLAVADADHAVAVAHHDQRGEAEPPATLHNLGDAVDRHDTLEVRGLLLGRPATAAIATVPAAA